MAYTKAPITEAVIELRFVRPFGQAMVEAAARRLRDEYFYDDREDEVRLNIDAASQKTDVEKAWLGEKLSSLDRTDIVFFRTTAFICSRLAPYTGWEEFIARTARAWEVWKKAVGPTELARVGVRYVNRIDIPMENNALIRAEDYLNTSPQSPTWLAAVPTFGYTMQIVKPLGSDDCSLVLTSGTVPSPLIGFVSLALDLDVFRETNLPRRDEELWILLNKIRHHKNRVFESCVTDKARELFD